VAGHPIWGSWLGTVKRKRREADRKLVAGWYLSDQRRKVNRIEGRWRFALWIRKAERDSRPAYAPRGPGGKRNTPQGRRSLSGGVGVIEDG
jgi:hypothetical protein